VSSSSLPGVWRAASAPSLTGGAAAPEARAEGCRAGALDLRALFQRHHASIWRLLRRLGVRDAQLDDAAQEVFWVAALTLFHRLHPRAVVNRRDLLHGRLVILKQRICEIGLKRCLEC